jgi:hypothetical protein
MELQVISETSALKVQTPVDYTKDTIREFTVVQLSFTGIFADNQFVTV